MLTGKGGEGGGGSQRNPTQFIPRVPMHLRGGWSPPTKGIWEGRGDGVLPVAAPLGGGEGKKGKNFRGGPEKEGMSHYAGQKITWGGKIP